MLNIPRASPWGYFIGKRPFRQGSTQKGTATQVGRLFPVFFNKEAPWGKARASAGVLSSVGLELR